MIILRNTYSSGNETSILGGGIESKQKEFAKQIDLGEIDISKYNSSVQPKVVSYAPKRTRTKAATLDLTNPQTFQYYKTRAQQDANRQQARQNAVAQVRTKGSKSQNKALKRQLEIERGAFKGERATGISRGSIMESAKKKLTNFNLDWNNPKMLQAQTVSLQAGRRSNKRNKGGIGIARITGDGEQINLTKQERFARLSDESKARLKRQQAAKRQAQLAAESTPLTKQQRIERLSPKYKAIYEGRQRAKKEALINKSVESKYGKGQTVESVRALKRYRSGAGYDFLARKASGKLVGGVDPNSKAGMEMRLKRLSSKHKQQLLESRSKRAPKQLPAVVSSNTTQLPAITPKTSQLPAVVSSNTTQLPTVTPKTSQLLRVTTTQSQPQVVEAPKAKTGSTGGRSGSTKSTAPKSKPKTTPRPKIKGGRRLGRYGKYALGGTALLGGGLLAYNHFKSKKEK